jgi:hypothetical protein
MDVTVVSQVLLFHFYRVIDYSGQATCNGEQCRWTNHREYRGTSSSRSEPPKYEHAGRRKGLDSPSGRRVEAEFSAGPSLPRAGGLPIRKRGLEGEDLYQKHVDEGEHFPRCFEISKLLRCRLDHKMFGRKPSTNRGDSNWERKSGPKSRKGPDPTYDEEAQREHEL